MKESERIKNKYPNRIPIIVKKKKMYYTHSTNIDAY